MAASTTHRAAWLKSKQAPLEVGTAETPKPGPGELLVKVTIIAFSPIESKLQKYEVHPLEYPSILGLSYAGIVEKVGDNVKNFKIGDKIAAGMPSSKINDPRYGAFQEYALAAAEYASNVPQDIPVVDVATSILNLLTVSAGLSIFLEMGWPALDGKAERKNKKVLIYGGTSSCGGMAIGYAHSLGYDVVTTASPKNWDLVASKKPSAIIDHTRSTSEVVADLQADGPYDKIFDTIGLPPVTDIFSEYLSKNGGGSYNTLIPLLGFEKPVPDNVERKFESYGWTFEKPEHEDRRRWFFEELVPVGLKTGKIVPTKAQWVEGGLENVQKALDLMEEGAVSGTKLVMELK